MLTSPSLPRNEDYVRRDREYRTGHREDCNGRSGHVWQRGQITDWTSTSQGTSDVRLDPQLNKKVWEQGVKGVPYRIRVRISRRRNDEDGAKEKLYSYVQAVNVKNPKGLVTTTVEEEEQ